jgi:D-alanyl-D-alanine carboxypeptidase
MKEAVLKPGSIFVWFVVMSWLPSQSLALQPDFQDFSVEKAFSSAWGAEGNQRKDVVTVKSAGSRQDRMVSSKNPSPLVHNYKVPVQYLPAGMQFESLMERLSKDSRGKHSNDSAHEYGGITTFEGRDDNPAIVAKILESNTILGPVRSPMAIKAPNVRAKALLCVDCSSNQVLLERNSAEPLPIASITKLITAMTVIDEMNLDSIIEVPRDIKKIEKHVVGIRPGDRLSVRDLLHGLLIESGNDCAEVLARAYPHGGRTGFMAAMNKRVKEIGATQTVLHTPSGLDLKVEPHGNSRNGENNSVVKISNTASAQDVALIARRAFSYPLIRKVGGMKTYTMTTHNERPREYGLVSNDKLLDRGLPLEGAKTGYTDLAGRCIVALFRDRGKERMVVVLNAPRHFNVAENLYRWASKNH